MPEIFAQAITPDANGAPMGATLVAGGATFRVWAPNATAVQVRGSFNNFEIRDDARLNPGPGGYWSGFLPGITAGASYKYWVTGPAGPGWKRDPWARELSESGQDCLVCSDAFPWHDTGYRTPQFSDFVIYQLHVGAYYAPRYPAHGTFLDVITKLPYLADLGVTAVQLLPIQEFPGDFGLGYNGTDYFSPEMAYSLRGADLDAALPLVNALLTARGLAPYSRADLEGDSNQLKALIDVAHAYGLAVIFDLVYNHAGGGFGDESLWFFDRQQGIETPEWWHSLYFSDRTWAGGVVFNFQSDPVREFLIQNAKFFLQEYRIDGIRFDEVSVIEANGYGRGRDFCQAMTGTLRTDRPDKLLIAEYWPLNPDIIREPGDNNGGGFHATMTDGPRRAIRAAIESASYPGGHGLPMTAIGNQLGLGYLRAPWRAVNSLENHDLVMLPQDASDGQRLPRMARLADPSNPQSWYGASRTRVATGLLLTMPGIPLLFMGQEFLEDKPWTDNIGGNPQLLLYWAGLDGASPVMRDFLRFVQELIRLRWQLPALRGEGYSLIYAHDDDRVLAFERYLPGIGQNVVVVAHLGDGNKFGYSIGFPRPGHWREAFNSDVYQNWVNPAATGNGGGIDATGGPLHDRPCSAALTLPANSILIFAQ